MQAHNDKPRYLLVFASFQSLDSAHTDKGYLKLSSAYFAVVLLDVLWSNNWYGNLLHTLFVSRECRVGNVCTVLLSILFYPAQLPAYSPAKQMHEWRHTMIETTFKQAAVISQIFASSPRICLCLIFFVNKWEQQELCCTVHRK